MKPEPVRYSSVGWDHINWLNYMNRGINCKKCARCKKWMPHSDFDSVPSKRGYGRRRYAARCKLCELLVNRRPPREQRQKRQANREADYSKDYANLPCLTCDIKDTCKTECHKYKKYIIQG